MKNVVWCKMKGYGVLFFHEVLEEVQ